MPKGPRPGAQPRRFLTTSHLRDLPTPVESLRMERVISVARLLLTVIALVGDQIEAVPSSGYAPVARLLLILFTAHSLSALVVLRTRQRVSRAFILVTFSVDLLAATLTLPLATATNSFFCFFLFVLAAAAFRWGFHETVATTVLAIALVLAYAWLARTIPALELLASGPYEFHNVVARTVYLAMMGLLLAYLAEEGRLLRAETSSVARLLSGVRAHTGVTRAVYGAAKEIVDLFSADYLLLIAEDLASHRLVRWDTARGWSVYPPSLGRPAVEDRDTYFFGPPDRSLTIRRRRWPWALDRRYDVTSVDAQGRVDVVTPAVPEAFFSANPFRRAIVVPIALGEEWSGRVFVVNPRLDVGSVGLAQFLQTIVQHVGPAVFNVYLLEQLRARAGAMERARVARELHDGVIQSLLGVEMQLQVLRGSEAMAGLPALADIERIQSVVHAEVLSLRELMQQVRPPEFDPDELLEYLADLVQRFGRDAGLVARFASDLRHVALPPRVCFELVRIVQEALVNVRKHARATTVFVRFGVDVGDWVLQVSDDGQGFPFEGRFELADLDAGNQGPTIIKERVRAIGARLVIESTREKGSRLEIRVPQERRG